MGNGVKILLVALLILSVVVVAKFVQEDSTVESDENPATAPIAKKPIAEKSPGNRPESRRSMANPSTRPGSRNNTTRRAGTGRIVGSTSSSNTTPSPGRIKSATPGTGRILTLPMKKSKPEESAKTAETGRTERSASDRVSVKVTPPPGGLSLNRSEEIGSPGFDPVPSPLAGKRADPLVSLDPKTPTGPDPPFKATQSDLRDFSKSKPLDPKETGPARTDPEVVITPFTTAISRGRSPFDRPVRSPGGRTPTPVPGTRTSGAFPKTHTVVRGDTYWDIAELYYGSGVQCKTIQKANGSKLLIPGMKLKVPAPPRPVVKETKPAAPVARSAPVTRLGKRAAIGEAATPTAPQAGTKSASASGKTAGAKSTVKSKDGRYYIHTVRAGETLSDLAKRYYNSPRSFDVIEEANPRLTYETLRVNQKIRIPVR